MLSSEAIRQITACGVSLPTVAAPPALARETVYMPSWLAALVLGRSPVSGVVIRDSGVPAAPMPDESAA
jgi:hypothetical protein